MMDQNHKAGREKSTVLTSSTPAQSIVDYARRDAAKST